MQKVIDLFTHSLSDFIDQATDRVIASHIPAYDGLPRPALRAAIERAFRATVTDLEQGTTEVFPAYLAASGAARMQQGARVTDILRGFIIGFEVVSDSLRTIYPDDLAAQLWWEQRRHQCAFAGALALMEQMIATRDDQIREQATQISTLSTPLFPVYRGVLALPLVGTIDTRRAQQIIETLLEGIVQYQAEVVIMDITGVPVVDTPIAQYLIQAAQAAQLLGAHIVLVGIRPEIAQTMVQLGANFDQLTTLAHFQAGVEYALGLQGRAITEK